MHSLPGVVPLYTAAEMRTVDRLAVEEIGIPGVVLMERAGLGAAADIVALFPDEYRVAVVCGAGNNGGDGFVVARHLAATGRSVEILLVEAESKVRRDSKVNLDVARNIGIPIERVNATAWKKRLREFDLVVDAMLGTGVSGAPRPNFEAVVTAIEASLLPVVSLDIPTGVDASTGTVETVAVPADLTLTFHGPKVGLAIAPGRFHAGRVRVVDIGIAAGAGGAIDEPFIQGLATPLLLTVIPPRARSANKYTAGTVACVGGSVGMAGAISLTTQAALRAGAGVVWGLVPEPLAQTLDAMIPEVQFRGSIADQEGRLTIAAAERIEQQVTSADAVVFGPGLGDSDQTRALGRWVLGVADALVIDAQGLAGLEGQLPSLAARDGKRTLLTPHEGELARLLGTTSEVVRANRLGSAREAAQLANCTVLLKGEDTIVIEPDGQFLVCRGHASQATSGSGDVLAGVAGALLARGLPSLLAGACAATACGIAAEGLSRELSSSGVVASDLLEALPAALEPDTDGGAA